MKTKSKDREIQMNFHKQYNKKIGGAGVEIKGGGSQEIEVSPPETLKFNYFPWDSQEEIANSISPCQERLIKKISLLSSLLLSFISNSKTNFPKSFPIFLPPYKSSVY